MRLRDEYIDHYLPFFVGVMLGPLDFARRRLRKIDGFDVAEIGELTLDTQERLRSMIGKMWDDLQKESRDVPETIKKPAVNGKAEPTLTTGHKRT